MCLDNKVGELICNYLNANNYKAPKSKHWSKGTILSMLRNEAYITQLKRDIAKISTQKDKLLNLMLTEENEELVKVYKEKLEDIIAQLSTTMDVYTDIRDKKQKEVFSKVYSVDI